MNESDPTPGVLTRRRLLKSGAVVGALLGLGGALGLVRSGYVVDARTRSELRSLSEKEFVVVEAIVARMMRPDAEDLPDPTSLGCAARIDRLVAKLDEETRGELKQLLHVVEHVLPFRVGRLGRFSRLDGASQDAVLGAMMTSEVPLLRGAFDALKSLSAMAYFQDPLAWEAIGYDGPLVGRPERGWVAAARLRGAR